MYDACLDGGPGHLIDAWAPEPTPDATNPTAEVVLRAEWPADPLGGRRPALAEAAGLVRRLMADGPAAALPGPVGPVLPGPVGPIGSEVEPVEPVEPEVDPEVARWQREADLLLAERAELTRLSGAVEVALPGALSVTQLVALRRDPAALARTLRRPVPAEPNPYARRGTAFHAWLEQRFGADRLLDLDELPGAADADAAPDEALVELQERFLASEWADRSPVEVEVPFATVIAGVVVRGRMDAVFARPGGRFDVVDWKTGAQPTGPAADVAAVQLAVYRLAWAELAGVPVDRVGAAFHYVRHGVTVRPADLLDVTGLTAMIAQLPEDSAQH